MISTFFSEGCFCCTTACRQTVTLSFFLQVNSQVDTKQGRDDLRKRAFNPSARCTANPRTSAGWNRLPGQHTITGAVAGIDAGFHIRLHVRLSHPLFLADSSADDTIGPPKVVTATPPTPDDAHRGPDFLGHRRNRPGRIGCARRRRGRRCQGRPCRTMHAVSELSRAPARHAGRIGYGRKHPLPIQHHSLRESTARSCPPPGTACHRHRRQCPTVNAVAVLAIPPTLD